MTATDRGRHVSDPQEAAAAQYVGDFWMLVLRDDVRALIPFLKVDATFSRAERAGAWRRVAEVLGQLADLAEKAGHELSVAEWVNELNAAKRRFIESFQAAHGDVDGALAAWRQSQTFRDQLARKPKPAGVAVSVHPPSDGLREVTHG